MKEIKAKGIGGNLDPKTREKLLCINKECIDMVYRELGRSVVMPGKVNGGMEELVRDYMNSKHLPEQAKAKLRRMVQAGMFSQRDADEIDATVERELDRCMTLRINKAIKNGELKPPKRDAFSERMRKRNAKTTRQLFS
jgi:Arc/MetJ-type ribon-helix-helix transcriptional regulator